jgi:hypothetical protein
VTLRVDLVFEVLGVRVASSPDVAPGQAFLRKRCGLVLWTTLADGLPMPRDLTGLFLDPETWAIARRVLPRLAKRGRLVL